MYKCIAIPTPDVKNTQLGFSLGDFENTLKRVADMDYDGIELITQNPGNFDSAQIKKKIDRHNLLVSSISTGQAYGKEGLSLTSPDKTVRNEAISRIKSQMDFACELDHSQVLIGMMRGELNKNEESISQIEEYLIKSLRDCANYNNNVNLTLEPINRYETNLYNTVSATRELVKKINMENVGLALDVFHMNIEEKDIIGSIRKSKRYLFHFQVADNHRKAFGFGHIDFNKIISVLNEINYDRAVSVETLMTEDKEFVAEYSVKYLKQLGL